MSAHTARSRIGQLEQVVEQYRARLPRLEALNIELLAALEAAWSAIQAGDTDPDSCWHTGINDTLGNVIRGALAKVEAAKMKFPKPGLHLGLSFTTADGTRVRSYQLISGAGLAIATADFDNATCIRYLCAAGCEEEGAAFQLEARTRVREPEDAK